MIARGAWVAVVALAASLLGVAALLLAGPPPALVDAVAARYPGCAYRAKIAAPVVALTIDDGPDARTTPRLLDLLAAHGARATFFLISERVAAGERTRAVVTALLAAGHEAGNHLTRDEPSIRLGPARFEAELLAADHALRAAGAAPRWARPGSAWYTPAMVAAMRRHGYRCALGSVYPYDPAIPWPRYAAWFILRNVRPGAIIVLHDHGARGVRTARTLAAVLPELRRRGYRVVTLSELMAMT
jgi:peptidoglycan-N-acetylglucosamine deacetylase